MSRWSSLVIAGVFLTGSGLCAYFAWDPPARGLEAIEPVHDFGELTQGQEVTAEIELVNRATKRVEIKQILKSCDCAQVKIGCMKLSPGDRTVLKTIWKTGSKRGRVGTDIGLVYQMENGAMALLALRLEATITPDIAVNQERLVFAEKERAT